MEQSLSDEYLNLNWQDLRSKCQDLNGEDLSESDIHLNLQDLIANRSKRERLNLNWQDIDLNVKI